MEVIVVSPTIQKFDGQSYYSCGPYFQRKGKRLHRVVWEYHNGPIPKGSHVHHKDEDRSNNQIENLMLMDGGEHLSVHMSKPERAEKSRASVVKAIEAAAEWHGTSAGAEWHSQHAKQMWAGKKMRERECSFCGRMYQTRDLGHNNGNHFCSNNCRAAHRRRRVRNGEISK